MGGHVGRSLGLCSGEPSLAVEGKGLVLVSLPKTTPGARAPGEDTALLAPVGVPRRLEQTLLLPILAARYFYPNTAHTVLLMTFWVL